MGAFGFGEMVLTAGIPATLGTLAITNFIGEQPFSLDAPIHIVIVSVCVCSHAKVRTGSSTGYFIMILRRSAGQTFASKVRNAHWQQLKSSLVLPNPVWHGRMGKRDPADA